MTKTLTYRFLFYITGLLVLALGLTLNTKAGLGVSPIISVSFSISEISGYNFGNMTLVLYCVFVVIQLLVHLYAGLKSTNTHASLKVVLLMDFLQIPLSIVFTRFLNMFTSAIPDLSSLGLAPAAELSIRFTILICAIICTGIGAAMSLNMRIIPNPGDGIVQTIADAIHKNVGFTKNLFDLTNIAITVSLSLIFTGHIVGVGVGTILAMIGVGRTIAVFNHFTYSKMHILAVAK